MDALKQYRSWNCNSRQRLLAPERQLYNAIDCKSVPSIKIASARQVPWQAGVEKIPWRTFLLLLCSTRTRIYLHLWYIPNCQNMGAWVHGTSDSHHSSTMASQERKSPFQAIGWTENLTAWTNNGENWGPLVDGSRWFTRWWQSFTGQGFWIIRLGNCDKQRILGSINGSGYLGGRT